MKQFLPSVLFVCLVVFGGYAKTHHSKFIGDYASVFESENDATKMDVKSKVRSVFAAMTLSKTDETCPSNGTITISLTGVPAGADVTYEYWNATSPTNVVTSTSVISGLGAGTYNVRAVIASDSGNEILERSITIVNNYRSIIATTTIKKVLCTGGSDGQITVNVTQGISSGTYQIISAPAAYTNPLPFSQSSNIFTGLTAGVYQIRVYDTCGLYNTITATVDVQNSYRTHFFYYRPTTDCQANVTHFFVNNDNNGLVKYPLTIQTTIQEISSGNTIATGSNTYTGTATAGTNVNNIIQPITFTNPNFVFPISITSIVTDACGEARTTTRIIRNNIRLQTLCPPEAGFTWNISTYQNIVNSDIHPHAVYPVTVNWVNSSNPSDSGSQTSSNPDGTVTGLTIGATYNVTITDACGKIRTSSITINNVPSNAGQTAFVNVLASCATGEWLPQFGTASGGNNRQIDSVILVSSPPGSGFAPGAYFGSGSLFNLWTIIGRSLIKGEWVFQIAMGCVVDTITVNAQGHGVELINADIISSGTCNSANVNINWSFVNEGVPIPWPAHYNQTVVRISLRDVTLPASATNSFAFQNGNLFLNVPNGTYNVIVNLPRDSGNQCLNKVIGQITVTSPGPQISSPYGYLCQSGSSAGTFGVFVNATGVGALEYAITAFNGTPVTPVWQSTNQFSGLADGIYTIEIKDNCATTSTVFSTHTISNPRVRAFGICPGQPGSLVITNISEYTYQWYKDGMLLTDTANITGTNTYQLQFASFNAPADEGVYSVHIVYADCIDEYYSITLSGASPNSGDDVTTTLCYSFPSESIDLDTYLSSDAHANGVWEYVSNNGGTLTENIFNPAGIDSANGPFTFKYVTSGYCNLTDEAVITINFNETDAPTGTAAQNFCSADAPTIADLDVTGTDIAWYATQTELTPLTQTTLLVSGTTYYATQLVAGCESYNRFAVTATLFAPPAQPIGNATQEFCNQAGATVADLNATGTGVVWYEDATVTTVLDPTTPLVDGAIYYAGSIANGCESATRLAVTVNFTQVAAPTTTNANQVFCEIDNATIADIETVEPGVAWFASETSTTPLDGTTALVSGTTYYGSITTNGCESPTRLAVTITITQTPAPTTSNSAQTFCEIDNATIADIETAETGVVWFADATSTTPLDGTTGLVNGATYYGAITTNGCESAMRLSVTITITQTPAPTTSNSAQTFCEIDNATIADIETAETGVVWFADATSTTPLDGTTVLVNGATYYGAITTNGCESATRLSVTITITQTPAPTTSNSAQTFCEIDNATIADIETAETGVVWFADATSTTPLDATTALVNGATYYGAITTNGCESATRLSVTVTITETVAPTTTASSQTFCEIDQATVADLLVSGTGIQWYADATSTTALPSDTVLTNGTYYATQATASCESATRLAVIVSITATVAPTGNATQTFCEIALPTVANLQATGTGVQWYADAASTTPLTAATPLTDGATYYATQTLNGCESLERFEVTVTITVTPAPTGGFSTSILSVRQCDFS